MLAKGEAGDESPHTLGAAFCSGYSGRKFYSLRAGMTQIIIVDLDGTLSDPGRKLEW